MNILFSDLSLRLSSVTVFKNVAEKPVIRRLIEFLSCNNGSEEKSAKVRKYTEFIRELYDNGCSLSDYLKNEIIEDENVLVKKAAKNENIPYVLSQCAKQELVLFSALTQLSSQELTSKIPYTGFLPQFENEPVDFLRIYGERLKNISKCGYGIYARYNMFKVDSQGKITPLKCADDIELCDLIGYENERSAVLLNTKALLQNKPAANTLLCGDAGTGKSSTVKAVANHFKNDGLRLIEIKKNQLVLLPQIMEQLNDNPLKFIIFIDDLSFNNNDENLGPLKAIIEGSAGAKAKNVVIYATSNRRHLVKETFSDRSGDDVHRRDTMQELLSLSERFGLVVSYGVPAKKDYLDIVHSLVKAKNIITDMSQLDIRAEAFALKKGGRSPRTAQQFTDSLLVGEG